jgi:hypothetical protein
MLSRWSDSPHAPAFGAEVREDAKSVFVELPVGFGVPLAPIGAWR